MSLYPTRMGVPANYKLDAGSFSVPPRRKGGAALALQDSSAVQRDGVRPHFGWGYPDDKKEPTQRNRVLIVTVGLSEGQQSVMPAPLSRTRNSARRLRTGASDVSFPGSLTSLQQRDESCPQQEA